METFLKDTLVGLSSPHKYLKSQYFYDDEGSALFRKIMDLEEYYLPDAELEIVDTMGQEIVRHMPSGAIDVIELGAGDGTKTARLLKKLADAGREVTYMPLDISASILELNRETIEAQVPEAIVDGKAGDYTYSLPKLEMGDNSRVVLFMGSNIGNMPLGEAKAFVTWLSGYLREGDQLLLGADLRKDPEVILRAYSDKQGITRQFNLNLLVRINRELGANFESNGFEHYAVYDPMEGLAKSYLVSLKNQTVSIGDVEIVFEKYEAVLTEVSKKFNRAELDVLRMAGDFRRMETYTDGADYFALCLYTK